MKVLFLSQGRKISDHPGWHDTLEKLEKEGFVHFFKNIPYFGYAEKHGWGAFYNEVVSEKGILAMHLSYTEKPFINKHFPSLQQWLIKNNIVLTDKNYYPFYFVYAILRGYDKSKLFNNANILVIHSAKGDKRKHIVKSLKNEGCKNIYWIVISPSRSLFDKIDINPFIDINLDFALVGAGVGKPNILLQLEPLNIPCIDAGFPFEV